MAQVGSRLRGGEIAVVAVSAVLVLVFAVVLLTRVMGPGEAAASATASATTTAEATPPAETPAPAGEDLSGVDFDFAAPSGNIACAIDAERALCGIAGFTYSVPAAEAAACSGTVGHFFQVTAEGASLVCDTSGQEPSIDTSGVPTLGYGQQEHKSGFTCDSTEAGMTCADDATGYSFSVRRAGYTFS